MKKKLALIVAIFTIIVIFPITYNYVHKYLIKKALLDEEQAKIVKVIKKVPHNYCLITYEVSSDKGKTWTNVILQSGQVTIFKKQCWKKYTQLLSNFGDAVDSDGNWYGKNKDDNLLSKPAMHFSPEAFTDNKYIADKAFTTLKK